MRSMQVKHAKRAAAWTVPAHLAVALAIWMGSQIPGIWLMELPDFYVATAANTAVQIVLVAGGLWLYARLVPRLSLGECRIGGWVWSPGWAVCALALPLALVLAYRLFVPGQLVWGGLDKRQAAEVLYYKLVGSCVGAAVTEEMIFRGFCLKVVERRWGRVAGMVVPSVVFGAMHILTMDMVEPLDAALLILSGTSVGVLFSVITLQTGSIWPGALVHGLWNFRSGLIGFGDQAGSYGLSTFVYAPGCSWAVTGGRFGVESSLIAMGLYWAAILLGVWGMRKDLGHCTNPQTF